MTKRHPPNTETKADDKIAADNPLPDRLGGWLNPLQREAAGERFARMTQSEALDATLLKIEDGDCDGATVPAVANPLRTWVQRKAIYVTKKRAEGKSKKAKSRLDALLQIAKDYRAKYPRSKLAEDVALHVRETLIKQGHRALKVSTIAQYLKGKL